MTLFKILESDKSTTLALPADLLHRLGICAGEYASIDATDEGLSITPCDAVIQKQMAVAEKVMKDQHEVLKRLAQS